MSFQVWSKMINDGEDGVQMCLQFKKTKTREYADITNLQLEFIEI